MSFALIRFKKAVLALVGIVFDVLGLAGMDGDLRIINEWVPILTQAWVYIPLHLAGILILAWVVAGLLVDFRLSKVRMAKPRQRLAELYASGVKLRNDGQRLATPNEVAKFVDDVRQWLDDAISSIRDVDPTDAEHFRTLNRTIHAIPLSKSINDDHELHFLCHDERLYRLNELLQRYSERYGSGTR